MKTPIRIFISYSHTDLSLVEELVKIIEEDGMIAMWDKNFSAGVGFHDQIKDFIAHAHLFMPVLTDASSKRGWVHQEIGYAMALHIPVFPVTKDVIPGEMIQHLQAIQFIDNPEKLKRQLSKERFLEFLTHNRGNQDAIYQCAAFVEDRARMMKEYSDKVYNLGFFGCIRQSGGMSSFHIPSKQIKNKVWTDRYFPDNKSDNHKNLQRDERIALERHAIEAGCKLIICPDYALNNRSILSANIRILTLIEFLESMPKEKVVIAIRNNPVNTESLTLLGDWFLAESVSVRKGAGFINTIFTRNAGEISKRLDDFDNELSDLLEELGWTEKNSVEKTIEILNQLLK